MPRVNVFHRLYSLLVPIAIVCAVTVTTPQAGSGQERSGRPADGSGRSSPGSEVAASETDVIEAFTEPYRDIAISAAEMGTLASVHIKEGDLVTAGSVLANLDDNVLQAALEVARAGKDALGQLKSAEAELNMRKTERQKLLELREREHASQREVDRVDTDLQIAEARVIAAREDIQIKQLEFHRIEAQLEQKRVRTPIDGVVTDVLKEAGEFVSPSDSVVARVVQLDPLLVVFSVPLHLRHQVVRDQRVGLGFGDRSRDAVGVVEYVSPTADDSNTSIRVKVRLANPSGKWQAGERTVLLLDRIPSSDDSSVSPLAKIDQ